MLEHDRMFSSFVIEQRIFLRITEQCRHQLFPIFFSRAKSISLS
jgi:hypothetical protein